MTDLTSNSTGKAKHKYVVKAAIPFILLHLSCFFVFLTGFTTTSVVLFFVLFFSRIFLATGVYHRYFSHKTYQTSRWFQFVLAFLVETSAQEGVIWWANHHRRHHQYSDTDKDVHSPRRQGFWYAHVGWIFTEEYVSQEYDMVKDWEKFPELVWINKYHYIPTITLGVIAWLIGGWSGLVVGFIWSTIAVYHSTFAINSLTHVFGSQRFITGDDSRNNIWLALLTFGEGWHNNHHYYSTCARQGFKWYEIDITYYILRGLAAVGLIWDIKEPPPEVIRGTSKTPRKYIERTKELITEASCAVEGFSDKLQELRGKVAQWVEEPSQYVNQAGVELCATLEQVALSLKERAHFAEKLPPKVAQLIKEKFSQASHCVENAIQSVRIKEQWANALAALEAAMHSLEFKELVVKNI